MVSLREAIALGRLVASGTVTGQAATVATETLYEGLTGKPMDQPSVDFETQRQGGDVLGAQLYLVMRAAIAADTTERAGRGS